MYYFNMYTSVWSLYISLSHTHTDTSYGMQVESKLLPITVRMTGIIYITETIIFIKDLFSLWLILSIIIIFFIN